MIQGPIEILNEDTAVQTLLGLNKAGDKYKNYWVFSPEPENVPYQVLFMTGNNPTNIKDENSPLDNVQFIIRTYDKVVERADSIAAASRAALENKNFEAGGYTFQRIYLVDQKDGYDNAALLPFRDSTYQSMVQRIPVT